MSEKKMWIIINLISLIQPSNEETVNTAIWTYVSHGNPVKSGEMYVQSPAAVRTFHGAHVSDHLRCLPFGESSSGNVADNHQTYTCTETPDSSLGDSFLRRYLGEFQQTHIVQMLVFCATDIDINFEQRFKCNPKNIYCRWIIKHTNILHLSFTINIQTYICLIKSNNNLKKFKLIITYYHICAGQCMKKIELFTS